MKEPVLVLWLCVLLNRLARALILLPTVCKAAAWLRRSSPCLVESSMRLNVQHPSIPDHLLVALLLGLTCESALLCDCVDTFSEN